MTKLRKRRGHEKDSKTDAADEGKAVTKPDDAEKPEDPQKKDDSEKAEEEKKDGSKKPKRESRFFILGIVQIEQFVVTVGLHVEQKKD